MTTDQITTKVVEIIAKQAGVEPAQVTRQHSFVADFGFDSLDKVELAMALEDTFPLKVPDDESFDLETVGQAIDFVLQAMQVNSLPAA